MAFAPVEGWAVVAAFDGGAITSDAGALLLGATDRAIRLVERFAGCFSDSRDAQRIVHDVATLVGQRVFAIALGYEDHIDYDELHFDPVLGFVLERLDAKHGRCAPLAGKSTPNRLGTARPRRAAITASPTTRRPSRTCWSSSSSMRTPSRRRRSRSTPRPPTAPLHGHQEGRFFRGYYDWWCYLPLDVFCGRHLLVSKLRQANIDASADAVTEIARVVARLRARWPNVRIMLRADGGFAREALMSWCEQHRVDFVFGPPRNSRLVTHIATELAWAEDEAEWMPGDGDANPRFVVTSLKAAEVDARTLYEDVYGARGEMENRLKECQLDLFADRTSAATMHANQLRLWFASMAYVLLTARRGRLPPETLEDRCPGHEKRPPHQDRHGLRLSLRRPLPLGPR